MKNIVKNRSSLLFLLASILFGLIVLLNSPAEGRQETAKQSLSIFTSILPQAYFVDRISGDRIRTEVLVQPGQSPHTFEPTPRQIARLAEADIFFRIGVEFEASLMPRLTSTLKNLRIVDCRQGIETHALGGHEEDQEHEEQHYHEGTDPHIWLSIRNVKRIAATIMDELVRLDPEGRTTYEAGYSSLISDLDALDRRITDILAPVRGKPLFVFHPAFGYFARDYGLEQIVIQTGGKEPSARQLADLIDEARQREVRIVFVQTQFSTKSAATIADAIHGAVVPLDPLAYDYIENLERIAQEVEEGLR